MERMTIPPPTPGEPSGARRSGTNLLATVVVLAVLVAIVLFVLL